MSLSLQLFRAHIKLALGWLSQGRFGLVWFWFCFGVFPHWQPDNWKQGSRNQNVHFLCSKNSSYTSLPTYCHLESRRLVQTKEGKGAPTDNVIYDSRHSASIYGWPRLCHTDVDIAKAPPFLPPPPKPIPTSELSGHDAGPHKGTVVAHKFACS